MTTLGKKVVLHLLRLTQIMIFAVVVALEYLADKRMWVLRYVVFKNAYYEEIFLKSQCVIPYQLILIIFAVIRPD